MTEVEKKLIKLLSAAEDDEPECRQVPDIFFPEEWTVGRKKAIDTAKTICARCPIKDLCLDYAMTAKEEFGIWAGTMKADRM